MSGALPNTDFTAINIKSNQKTLVSETDRHVIVLGADPISGNSRTGSVDPMLVAFSDQENPLDFDPSNTNTAGSLRLSEGSQIIGGVKARQEILIWTDVALYSMQFIGPPYTFGLNLINDSSGLVAPKGAVSSPSGVYWMGYDSFYSYNGSYYQTNDVTQLQKGKGYWVKIASGINTLYIHTN